MKTLVVVQARTGSARLPGKVLMPLAGEPLLRRMIERVRSAGTPFDLVVATTTESADEGIRALCRRIGVECFSGHPTDLLDRHYRAAVSARADEVVKIPSDCPLIDPAVIDRVLAFHAERRGTVDYTGNLHPATYPDGNDVEVVPFPVLEEAHREAARPFEREHTTPFIWERPGRYRTANAAWETGLNYAMTHRWTIDYPEDYAFIKTVYDELWSPTGPPFTLGEILRLLDERPEIAQINAAYAGVNWYGNHAHELTTVSPSEYRQIA